MNWRCWLRHDWQTLSAVTESDCVQMARGDALHPSYGSPVIVRHRICLRCGRKDDQIDREVRRIQAEIVRNAERERLGRSLQEQGACELQRKTSFFG